MVLGGFLLYCWEQGTVLVLYMMLYHSVYIITALLLMFRSGLVLDRQ